MSVGAWRAAGARATISCARCSRTDAQLYLVSHGHALCPPCAAALRVGPTMADARAAAREALADFVRRELPRDLEPETVERAADEVVAALARADLLRPDLPRDSG